MKTCFGPFVLDAVTRQLTRENLAVHLTPKAFELLTTLVRERPRALSKSELLERLWPATFVAEANLSNLVAEIRRALDDTARNAHWIRTSHGFGYAFCGNASAVHDSHAMGEIRPTCWLEWGTRRFPLSVGEHIIGRDADVAVRLDASTVSRRHARLVVALDRASLEDVGSKNGTRRGNDSITHPVPLADGDRISFGSLLLTFRFRKGVQTTDTHPAHAHHER